ncbi:GGDEF domain-containing protein [Lacticaseibacillus sharpeae]|uniref:GGDEF domain-containing protein n=1 Tax=Lacticaseibacillus sharpeae JCM 1186 = DSM 20505 TaxID=1291052 RepID=A0A0R1ZL56_9LACO|nr:GGDEF domain-containing protein [Lacticaseibacillus sharpeae]KRM55130.1 hypothetical protein FC18_GL001578 [Lacticaseibacillus sharpeae JCM 1186 = DSM 20505]
MALTNIILAQILTLSSNFIVMVGAISFIYWLNSSTANPFVVAHHQQLTYITGCLFLVFLVAQLWRGWPEWPYLDMLIVTLYMVNLQQGIRWPAVLDLVLIVLLTLWLGAPLSASSVAGIVVAGGILFLTQTQAKRILARPVLNGCALVAFGTAVMVSQLNLRQTNLWFWLQQLGTLAILGGLCLAFDQIMRATRARTDKMYSLTTIDELTGVHNFGTFNKELDQLFAQFQKDGQQYSVFEGDLDHFKHINDTYGHPAGNVVLRQLALELDSFADTLPFPATAYRLGGEEFAIIAHAELNHEQAMAIGERFLALLTLVRFPDADPNLTITCSIGQARVEPGDYSANDVYKKADRNLYAAKQGGRNCVQAQGDAATK